MYGFVHSGGEMRINSIEISNFRSFRKLKIELGKFNVLIGPNAAGKSNFIQIFKFIRDIVSFGLENAVSMQGGGEYLRNLNLNGKENQLRAKINISPFNRVRAMKETSAGFIGIRPVVFDDEFILEFAEKGSECYVAYECLYQKFEFFSMSDANDYENMQDHLGMAELKIINDNGVFSIDFKKDEHLPISKDDLLPSLYIDIQSFANSDRLRKTLFIENQYYMPHPDSVRKAIGDICIYDLDPNQPKSVTSIAGKAELEENGENLAIILKKILSDKDKSRKLFNLIKYMLPFVEDLEVEKFLDKYLQLTVKEKFVPNQYLPASLMSSGSLFIIAIIIALYFENKTVSIFEEPARRIHPFLISKVIDMMKDASKTRQVLLSTHNPEIVKYAGLDNIFFVSRDEEGFSVINRPGDQAETRAFLENEIGIEELYIQNLLS